MKRGIARRRAGFTLLELLVVLVLFAVTAAAAVPAFLSESFSTPEQRAATTIAGVLSQARAAARESGSSAKVVISPNDGRYWIVLRDSTATSTLSLPATVTLAGPSTERFECTFTAAGPATALTIIVRGAQEVEVRVDGWSGEIIIGDGRAL